MNYDLILEAREMGAVYDKILFVRIDNKENNNPSRNTEKELQF